MNFYEILGVPKNATENDIKKAYRSLAKKHHPDKGGDEEEFKKITQAYETLVNPESKEKYDNPVLNQGPDIGNIFASMFSQFGMGQNNLDIILKKEITLFDIFNGNSIKIDYERRKQCSKCNGSCISSTSSEKCKKCKGDKMILNKVTLNIGQIIQQVQCPLCKGKGYPEKELCKDCKGEGTKLKDSFIEIPLPKHFNGDKIIGKEKGHVSAEGYKGNCIIFIVIKESSFTRQDADLIYVQKISLLEALYGCSFTIQSIDKKELKIVNNNIISPGSTQILTNEGMYEDEFHRGNLIIKYDVIFPTSVNKDTYEQMKSIIG